MNKSMLSILHSLSVMNIEQIELAKTAVAQESSFNQNQKKRFLTLCDIAIEERRRRQSGDRKI